MIRSSGTSCLVCLLLGLADYVSISRRLWALHAQKCDWWDLRKLMRLFSCSFICRIVAAGVHKWIQNLDCCLSVHSQGERHRALPWDQQKQVHRFYTGKVGISSERIKRPENMCCNDVYRFCSDIETLVGLPRPIHESVKTLKQVRVKGTNTLTHRFSNVLLHFLLCFASLWPKCFPNQYSLAAKCPNIDTPLKDPYILLL